MNEICKNAELREYIEEEIIPLYDEFDAGHRRDHVLTVIAQSLELAQYYDVDINVVYVVAAYHDVGLVAGRERHHIVSGEMVAQDVTLRRWFDDKQIATIVDAVVDHRASNANEPRTIYGKIVAEADRIIDASLIVRRTIQYGLCNYPHLDKDGHYRRFVEHINEKYAEGGYLKLWIPQSQNAKNLHDFRQKIKKANCLQLIFEDEWGQLVKK